MRQIYFIALTISVLFPQIANACEPNSYSSRILSREDWQEIKRMMNTSGTAINQEPVMRYHITSIIGSPSSCSSSSGGRVEKCLWIDRQDCKKKIKASFRDDDLAKITKSGF